MKGFTFGLTRFVDNRWIDQEKTPNEWAGKEIPFKDDSPSGLYPCVIVPEYLRGRKVLIIPVDDDNAVIPLEELKK